MAQEKVKHLHLSLSSLSLGVCCKCTPSTVTDAYPVLDAGDLRHWQVDGSPPGASRGTSDSLRKVIVSNQLARTATDGSISTPTV